MSDEIIRYDARPGALVKVSDRIAVRVRELADDPMDDGIGWRWADDIRRGPSTLDFDKGYTVIYESNPCANQEETS